jgi:hypothetical protein
MKLLVGTKRKEEKQEIVSGDELKNCLLYVVVDAPNKDFNGAFVIRYDDHFIYLKSKYTSLSMESLEDSRLVKFRLADLSEKVILSNIEDKG